MNTYALYPKRGTRATGDLVEMVVQAESEIEARKLASVAATEAGLQGNWWENKTYTACVMFGNGSQVLARTFVN